MYKIAIIIFSLLLSGCVPMQQNVMYPDYTAPPKNYETTIKNYLKESLKDPDSLKDLIIAKPYHATLDFTMLGKGVNYYNAVCARYNAKNSYGGYTGVKGQIFYFVGDDIKEVDSKKDCS